MIRQPDEVLRSLQHQGWRLACVATGGGASALAELLNVPGASGTMLEVVVPYYEPALHGYLLDVPERACSAATATQLAERALTRARSLAPGRLVAGLGCTAALVTTRPKQGEHRCHVAIALPDVIRSWTLQLAKSVRTRASEELVVDQLVLHVLTSLLAGGTDRFTQLGMHDQLTVTECVRKDLIPKVCAGMTDFVGILPDGRQTQVGPIQSVIVSGSFNPLHRGHRELARAGVALTGLPAAYELSVANVDKPLLPYEEVVRRLPQFTWLAPLWVTRAAKFADKCQHFPGSVFAIGYDTARRLLDPAYYGGDVSDMRASLLRIKERGCRFLVAGRKTVDGVFRGFSDLPLPDYARDVFQEIPETMLHVDVCSTELRTTGQHN